MGSEEKIRAACAALDAAGISYTRVDHPAAFTIEEMDAIALPHREAVAKNLFLRDQKGKRYFLVVLPGHKRADLKTLGEILGTRLSFASEERLGQYLGLEKGSVTPLGVLNDEERVVEVFFDMELNSMPLMGVHPNQNTATVFLKPEDLAGLIRDHGNPFKRVEL